MRKLTFPMALCAVLTAPLMADVLVVDPVSGTPFASIQAAVNAATDGDVVLVRAGSYVETVDVVGLGVTIVGDGPVLIAGTISVIDLPAGATTLIGGLSVTAESNLSQPGILIDRCLGPVRIVDSEFVGSDDQTLSAFQTFPTGPGALVQQSTDVAFIDSRLKGGQGCLCAGLDLGLGYDGAAGLRAIGIEKLAIVRSVCRGGGGLWDIFGDGRDGGHGALLDACPRSWIAYSAFIGGAGGDGDWPPSSSSGDGGDGLSGSLGTTVWNFGGVFIGGYAGCSSGTLCNPGNPGLEIGGSATIRSLNGFPTSLSAPLLVRAGQPFAMQVSSSPGQPVRTLIGAETRAAFRPGALQPLLIRLPALQSFHPTGVIPSSGQLTMNFTAGPIAGGADAQVDWLQMSVEESSGIRRLSSPRPMIVIDPSF